jgi:hypothetical protein
MDQFSTLISIIEAGFKPINVTNEAEAEKELIQFLNSRFPNMVTRQGHTSTGLRIDIVIEGTIAIELVTIDNEARLATLLNQIIKSKEDFSKIAVILIDLGKVNYDNIQNYVNEFQKLNVKTIIKRITHKI